MITTTISGSAGKPRIRPQPRLRSPDFCFFPLGQILMLLCLWAVTTACNEETFSSSLTASESSLTETFTVKAKPQLPLRMMWLIDNSDSMKDDHDTITQGLTSFSQAITTTFQDLDLKSMLVSKMHGDDASAKEKLESHGITVDKTATAIRSNDALRVARRAILTRHQDFFTDQTLNIFIVVSDDASDLPAEEFLRFIDDSSIAQRSHFRFYGFIDKQQDQKKQGHYATLASTLQGKLFDVLQHGGLSDASKKADWDGAFHQIKEHVENDLKGPIKTFELKHHISDVLSVSHNGEKVLNASDYTMTDTQVRVLSEIEIGDTIAISYRPTTSS